MRVVLGALIVMCAAATAARAADLRYFNDATLRSVHFADAKEGWAVGDEGVVWHTIDGGATWERQATGTRASLRSVFFLPENRFIGWIAGREEQALGQGSVGVLMFTADGGVQWRHVLTNAMPGLNRVRFTDAKIGYVFGDGSDQFPTGVFKTNDGGRTWEAVAGPRSPTWLAGDFLTGQTGILAGAWDRLATFRVERAQAFEVGDVESLGGRNLNGVFVFNRRALAVGAGGLVLTSESQGARWGFADVKLPSDVVANLDFQAVHGVGDQAWIVGRPGSVLLHSPDQGLTWKMHKTGHSLPLRSVFFVDDKHGWTVGDYGSILASVDGGQSWKVQHQGGKRAALLLVHACLADVPVDMLARVGAEDGYLATVLRVVSAEPASASVARASDPQRLAAAVRQAGGASAESLWQFPLPQHLDGAGKHELLKHWNKLHGKQADKQLLRQLVLALRTWRPDVVVTDHPDGAITDNSAGALVAEALHQAVAQAADGGAFPEQIAQLGLAPWRVSKTFTQWEKREGSDATVTASDVRPRLEGSASDYAGIAAGMLADRPRLPAQRFFRLLDNPNVSAGKQSYLMAGVAPGPDARRALPEQKETATDTLKAFRTRRSLEIIAGNLNQPDRALAQIGPLLARLPDDQGAAAALAIANQYARRGQWAMARETFLLMVDRYPAHPLSAAAYGWLIRHISSSEARRRHELEQFLLLKVSKGVLQASAKGGKNINVNAVERSGLAFLSEKMESRQWYRGSFEFGKRLAGFGPLFASDPGTQFCLQASRRNLGEFEEARGWYEKFRTHFPKGSWHDAAAAELWLERRAGPPPKPAALCRRVEERPYLDGKLDDPCWKGTPLILANAVGATSKEYPTEAWFAYDQENLYLALRCKHPPGKQLPPVKGRKHDADLRPFDRVSILLDLDRDYATYFHLQVDQRGCLFEDCWGDPTWDPRWFIAVQSTETSWQIEAAIPLTELTGDRLRAGTAWAVNVVRVLPRQGVQAFSLPADIQPRPEGMGLLLFN